MKKCFLHILLVGVLGMLAVSCSDEYDSMGLDSRQAQVVFSVAMDTPVSRSRTAEDNTWGSQYDPSSPGDAYDNRIRLLMVKKNIRLRTSSSGKLMALKTYISLSVWWKELISPPN